MYRPFCIRGCACDFLTGSSFPSTTIIPTIGSASSCCPAGAGVEPIAGAGVGSVVCAGSLGAGEAARSFSTWSAYSSSSRTLL
jgi:hypothetical protein